MVGLGWWVWGGGHDFCYSSETLTFDLPGVIIIAPLLQVGWGEETI